MTGQEVVLDFAGNAVGTRRSTDLACDRRFGIEIWTQVPNQPCVGGTTPQKQYGYFLIPCVRAATISGDITIDGANAVSLELTAKTTIPSLWGVGPENGTLPQANYDVIAVDAVGTPGHLLTPIGPTDHDHMQLTSIAPPPVPADCGCVALDSQVLPNPGIVSVEPAPLPVAGGAALTINGFGFTGVTSVTIDGVAVAGFVVVNDTTITAPASPALPAGEHSLVVTGPGGVTGAKVTAA